MPLPHRPCSRTAARRAHKPSSALRAQAHIHFAAHHPPTHHALVTAHSLGATCVIGILVGFLAAAMALSEDYTHEGETTPPASSGRRGAARRAARSCSRLRLLCARSSSRAALALRTVLQPRVRASNHPARLCMHTPAPPSSDLPHRARLIAPLATHAPRPQWLTARRCSVAAAQALSGSSTIPFGRMFSPPLPSTSRRASSLSPSESRPV